MTAAKPGPKHAPRVPFAVLVTALIAGGLALLLLLNTASAANEVRRHDLAAKDASIAARVEELQNEVARSAAPGNVAKAAAELGMVPAGHPAFLVIGPDGSVKVVGRPKAVLGVAIRTAAHESKSPKPSHVPTSRNTKSATRTATATPGRATGGARTVSNAAGRHRPSSRAATTPTPPTPSPTPTPTLTLPGGDR